MDPEKIVQQSADLTIKILNVIDGKEIFFIMSAMASSMACILMTSEDIKLSKNIFNKMIDSSIEILLKKREENDNAKK